MPLCRIYKIVNTKTNDLYIGSTIQELRVRFKAHRSNAKLNKNGLLYDCMRTNGIENFTIETVEEFEFSNKKEVGLKEKYYYEELKPTLNMIVPRVPEIIEYGRIYKVFNKLKIEEFYIGSTTESVKNRFYKHKSASNKGTTPIYLYMREIGKDNFALSLSCSVLHRKIFLFKGGFKV